MTVNHELMSQFIDQLAIDRNDYGEMEGLNKLCGDLIDAIKQLKAKPGYPSESALHTLRGQLKEGLEARGIADAGEMVRNLVSAIQNGYYVWDEGPEGEEGSAPRLRRLTEQERAGLRTRVDADSLRRDARSNDTTARNA